MGSTRSRTPSRRSSPRSSTPEIPRADARWCVTFHTPRRGKSAPSYSRRVSLCHPDAGESRGRCSHECRETRSGHPPPGDRLGRGDGLSRAYCMRRAPASAWTLPGRSGGKVLGAPAIEMHSHLALKCCAPVHFDALHFNAADHCRMAPQLQSARHHSCTAAQPHNVEVHGICARISCAAVHLDAQRL